MCSAVLASGQTQKGTFFSRAPKMPKPKPNFSHSFFHIRHNIENYLGFAALFFHFANFFLNKSKKWRF
jgi:hypothetical protein